MDSWHDVSFQDLYEIIYGRKLMALGVKLPHIRFDNNLIKFVHRIVLSPFQSLRRRKCTGIL